METNALEYQLEYQESTLTAAQVRGLSGATLLEFGIAWCGHCQAANIAIKTALQTTPTLRHLKIIDGKGKRLGRAYKVKQWPTLIFLENGQELGRLVRPLQSESILELFAMTK